MQNTDNYKHTFNCLVLDIRITIKSIREIKRVIYYIRSTITNIFQSNDALFNEVIVHLQEIFIISSIAFSRHKNKITTRENKTESCKKKHAEGKEI
jgi:hypothetical protein